MKILSNILAISVLILPTLTAASEFDSEILFQKGNWIVEVTYDNENGNFWCSATTTNGSSQSFGITAYDTNDLMVFVLDTRWSLSERPVTFYIDVDYARWTIDGYARDIGVSVFLDDADKSVQFLREVQQGNAVAVYNERESRLATFSLNGSYAAIVSMFDCWDKISKTDPFSPQHDPF